MEKQIITLCLGAALALSSISCNQITYSGDFTPDGEFIGESAIYFDHEEKADTLKSYSFGPLPAEITSQTVDIPIRILGDVSSQSLTYHVVADETETTAKPRIHYTPLKDEYHFRQGAVTDTLRVEILRDALDTEDEGGVKLVLKLQGGNGLKVAFERENRQVITFNNHISEPYWWVYYESWLGGYHRLKYLKLLEYYENDPTKLEESLNNGELSRLLINNKKMYDYFKAHPEIKVPLPPVDPSTLISFQE